MSDVNFWDSNFRILLKDGKHVDVVYPERVGCEYDTPWLNTPDRDEDDRYPGSRSWGRTEEFITNYHHHQLGYNAKLVIGKWGTGYHEMSGVYQMIPIEDVVGLSELNPEDYKRGMDNYKKERVEANEKAHNDPNRTVTLGELNALRDEVDFIRRYLNVPRSTGKIS